MENKMIKIGFYTEETLMSIRAFLDEIFAGMETESYDIVPRQEGGGDGWVYLSDTAIRYLKTHNDHECTALSGGCEFCSMLHILNIFSTGE